MDFYGGATGLAVFFSALAGVTGNRAWQRVAEDAMPPDFLASALAEARPGARLGACRGPASVAYGLTLVASLSGNDQRVAQAIDIGASISAADIDADTVLDVEGGCAGTLLALLALHSRRPAAQILGAAARCVDRLLGTQLSAGPARGAWAAGRDARPRPGFAHGAAGIACALERWLAQDDRPAVRSAIHAAWEFERRVFAAAGGSGWPTSRSDGSRIVMAAWCHGAPGVALARASGGGRAADAHVSAEIGEALTLTGAAPASRHDHLCCGNLGRADALLTAGILSGRPEAAAAGRALAARVAAQVVEQGRHGMRGRGFDRGAASVGLFQGLAGIGYELVRAHAPERVPSVLTFQVSPAHWMRDVRRGRDVMEGE
jgi:lantibiotic modifying enzyme